MEWDNDNTILLIEEYKKRRLLWDKGHEHYENEDLRKELVQDLANIVNTKVEEVEKKIGSLLEVFRRGTQKVQRLQEKGKLKSIEKLYRPKWFRNLLFLAEGHQLKWEWDDEKTTLFIEHYKNRNILWDQNHDQHKSFAHRNASLKELAKAVNMDVAEVKRKIRKLLQISWNNNKKLQDLKEAGDVKGVEALCTSKWFMRLQFLSERYNKTSVWDDDKIALFIQEYRKRRVLWDQNHVQHNNKEVRSRLMNELADIVNMDTLQVKKQIRRLLHLCKVGNERLNKSQEKGELKDINEVCGSKWFSSVQFLTRTRKKKLLKWDDDKTAYLIKEYQKKELLWDRNHKDYTNKELRKQHMKELADIMDVKVFQVERKIHFLLALFKHENKKLQELKENGAEVESVGKWFESLQFLSKRPKPTWDDDATRLLIEEYRKRRSLWDKNHEDYNDRELRTKSMIELAKILDRGVAEVRNKISLLRIMNRRGSRKIKEQKETGKVEDSGNTHASKWFESLQFISEGRMRTAAIWDAAQTALLIKEYENRRILWDKTHQDYNSKIIRKKHMAELTSILNKDTVEIKRKIQSLIQEHVAKKRKIQKQEVGMEVTEKMPTPTWLEYLCPFQDKSKSDVMEWDEDKTLFLIQEYEKRRSLWDKNHPLFTNREVRLKLMEEIASTVNEDINEVKRKIFSLIQISRGLNKYGPRGKKLSTTKWFKRLQFLSERTKSMWKEWDDNKTLLLIQELKKRRILWDKGHKQHKDKKLRAKCIAELVDIIKEDAGEIKRKLHNFYYINRNGSKILEELEEKGKKKSDSRMYALKWYERLQFISTEHTRKLRIEKLWDDDKTLLLIEEYKKRRALWDKQHEHFKNKDVKNDLMNELANILKVDVVKIRKKIHFLLTMFSKQNKRLQGLDGTAEAEGDEPKWFRQLNFLPGNYRFTMWSDEKTMLLIKEYEKLRFLWDESHKYYGNVELKAASMQQLARLVKIDVTEIKKKIRALCRIYALGGKKPQEVDGKEKTEGGEDAQAPKWLESLQFLSERNNKWNNETYLKLIKEYQKRRHLWDKRNKLFKSKKDRSNAWIHIGRALKIDSQEVETNMKMLLDKHTREKRKMLDHYLGGSTEPYESKWFAFESFQFLREKDQRVQMAFKKKVVKAENIPVIDFSNISGENNFAASQVHDEKERSLSSMINGSESEEFMQDYTSVLSNTESESPVEDVKINEICSESDNHKLEICSESDNDTLRQEEEDGDDSSYSIINVSEGILQNDTLSEREAEEEESSMETDNSFLLNTESQISIENEGILFLQNDSQDRYECEEDFGHYIAEQLKTLPELSRASVMRAINNLIYNTHMGLPNTSVINLEKNFETNAPFSS